VWTSPAWAAWGVRLLEISSHSRGKGVPNEGVTSGGDRDMIATGLQNEEEAEELPLSFRLWFSPSSSSSASTSSLFYPPPRAGGGRRSLLSSPSIEGVSTGDSTCDASNNSILHCADSYKSFTGCPSTSAHAP
jgi:hypothetical protein